MTINKKDIMDFEKMFDILPTDKKKGGEGKSDSDQYEEYGHSTEIDLSFEELSAEVSEDIKINDEKGYDLGIKDPHEIVKEVCKGEVEPAVFNDMDSKEDESYSDSSVQADNVIEVEDEAEDEAEYDFFDEVSEDSGEIESDSYSKEEGSGTMFTEKTGVKSFTGNSSIGRVDSGGDEVGDGDDYIEWMLDSPSSMYNSFYQKKRDLLFKYMVGGEVQYKRWTKELEEASVIIQGEIFDHNLIIKQMEAVQQYRERVKAIHVKVNNQYFTFKRFVEMMRGFLARVEYLKPVARQEGLIMEHMRDLELYYARLEALHDSANKTEKTLAAAFDTLSRKCTICMELKPPERVDVKSNPEYLAKKRNKDVYYNKEEKEEESYREQDDFLKEFDDLPSNATAAPAHHKIGSIGWGEI